jgi:hypothetical protein
VIEPLKKNTPPAREPKVVLDFDGVLHGCRTGWHLSPDMKADPVPRDVPVPGAVEFCHWLIANRFVPVIHSARNHAGGYMAGVVAMRLWLEHWQFPWMEICLEKPQDMCLFVDDKGFRFEGDFAEVQRFLEDMRVFDWPDSWAKFDYQLREQKGIQNAVVKGYGKRREISVVGKPNFFTQSGNPRWLVARELVDGNDGRFMRMMHKEGLAVVDERFDTGCLVLGRFEE